MNEEIKEILDKMKKCEYDEFNELLDYITNLQKKIEQYENPEDLTLFYMWLDEKAKDKMRELQQENERLKEKYNIRSKAYNKILLENSTLSDYKSRCEKAIELINSYSILLPTEYADEIAILKRKIRKILQGSDKE